MDGSQPQQGVIPAPPGYEVDLENPTRKMDQTTYIVCIVGFILMTGFLSIRIYTKAMIARIFGADDVCIIIAWMCSIGTQAMLVHNFHQKGEGTHLWEITVETFNLSQKLIMAASVVYVPCLGFAKFSLLLLYHRLAPQKWFHILLYIIMTVVLGYSFAIIFALIFACTPIEKNWDASITTGSCINRSAIYVMTAVVNIVTDVAILLVPIPIILKLQMPRIQKFGIIAMFGIGSLTVVTSIVRLVTLFPMLTALDQPWAVATPSMWICVEANLVIICGSLPALRQFFKHVAPSFIGEKAYSDGTGRTGPNSYPLKGHSRASDSYDRLT